MGTELKRQNAELATAPAPEHEEAKTRPGGAERDDFWAAARDFDWGD